MQTNGLRRKEPCPTDLYGFYLWSGGDAMKTDARIKKLNFLAQ